VEGTESVYANGIAIRGNQLYLADTIEATVKVYNITEDYFVLNYDRTLSDMGHIDNFWVSTEDNLIYGAFISKLHEFFRYKIYASYL